MNQFHFKICLIISITFFLPSYTTAQNKSIIEQAIKDSALIEKIIHRQQYDVGYGNEEYHNLKNQIDSKSYIWSEQNVTFKNANTGSPIKMKANTKWICNVLLIKNDKYLLAIEKYKDENEEHDVSNKYDIVILFTDITGNSIAFNYDDLENNFYEKEITINDNSTLYSFKEEKTVIKSNLEAKNNKDAELRIRNQREQLLKKKEAENVKLYGQINGNLINNQGLKIGFTKPMCLASWGKPISIKTVTTSEIKTEYWYYLSDKKLIFQNSKLTRIEDNK